MDIYRVFLGPTEMSNASDLCREANEKYVDEDYQRAVELYTEALGLDSKRDDIYCHRAQAQLQLGNFEEAADDCTKAIELNENNNKAYLRKGTALFQLKEFDKALDVFKEGQKRFESEKVFDDWIKKCNDKQPKINQPNTDCPATKAPSSSSVRHEWYQTHTHVIITVFAKNVKKDNLSVDVNDRQIKLHIKDYQGLPYDLNLELAHAVVSQESNIKLLSTKIEIKLKKNEGIQWAKLEGSSEEEVLVAPTANAPVDAKMAYPSSSHYAKDWDKIEAEVKEEEKNENLEGDAGLNSFFQKLYKDASDETKKAMMKSFSESGGTVLSTNWSEVGAKKVEVKPPDGMEYKKWEV